MTLPRCDLTLVLGYELRAESRQRSLAGEGTSPNAAVLFNPALMRALLEGVSGAEFAARDGPKRMGIEPRRMLGYLTGPPQADRSPTP